MSKSAKIWGIAGLAVVVALGLIMAAAKSPSGTVSGSVSLENGDWTLGNRDAKVVLIEYSDFACPACKSAASVVDQLLNEFGDHMVFAYRHFPLDIPGHKNAPLAARASEAAGLQGKFYDMSDKLFFYQDVWKVSAAPDELFSQYAEEIGLDMEKFEDDYSSGEVKDAVNDDLSDSKSLNLNSTPTFFLNGQKINQPRSYDAFRSLIRDAINAAENS